MDDLIKASTEPFQAGGRRWVARFAFACLDMKEAWSVSGTKAQHCIACYHLAPKIRGRSDSGTEPEGAAHCALVLGPDANGFDAGSDGAEESSPCQCCGVLFRTSQHKIDLRQEDKACCLAGFSDSTTLPLERFPGTNLFEFAGSPDELHVVSGAICRVTSGCPGHTGTRVPASLTSGRGHPGRCRWPKGCVNT